MMTDKNSAAQHLSVEELAVKLVGFTGADKVRENLDTPQSFLVKLHDLNVAHMRAVILRLKELNAREPQHPVQIMIPKQLVEHENCHDIDEFVVDETIAEIRNDREKLQGRFTVTADSSAYSTSDTTQNIAAITDEDILNMPLKKWLESFTQYSADCISEEMQSMLETAFAALFKVTNRKTSSIALDLQQFSNFCASVVLKLQQEPGCDVRTALGYSLPQLMLPRDSQYFSGSKFKSGKAGQSAWNKAFSQLFTERANFFQRNNKKGESLKKKDLLQNMEELFQAHPETRKYEAVILDYINTPARELKNAACRLFELEWEKDNISKLFGKVKVKQDKLGDQTIRFFDDHFANELKNDDRNFLENIANKSSITDPEERAEVVEFFNNYRDRMAKFDQKLLKRWEKFVFKTPVSCHDFYAGLIQAFTDNILGKSKDSPLTVKMAVKRSLDVWKSFYYPAGCFFELMYKSLPKLLQGYVQFELPPFSDIRHKPLFDFAGFIEECQQKEQLKISYSTAKDALTLPFEITADQMADDAGALDSGSTGDNSFKLELKFDAGNIGLFTRQDINTILNIRKNDRRCVLVCVQAERNPVSPKGELQPLSLYDVSTIHSNAGNQAGQLVCADFCMDIAAQIRDSAGVITDTGLREKLLQSLQEFEDAYADALSRFVSSGLDAASAFRQADKFADLLRCIRQIPKKSIRQNLLVLALSTGTVKITEEQAVIITPWQPERLKSLALRQQRIVNYCINAVRQYGQLSDKKLYIRTLQQELEALNGPELFVSLESENDSKTQHKHVLLHSTQNVNGYSLMEPVIRQELRSENARTAAGSLFTDGNAEKAAEYIVGFIRHYLQLYPHLRSNLNVLLYDCSLIDLPYQLLQKLHEEEFEDCQIKLCFTSDNFLKLNMLYQRLLSSTNTDTQAQLNHLHSDIFLSNIRVSLQPLSALKNQQQKMFDLCILYDAVSVRAKTDLRPVGDNYSTVTADRFNPARVSYRCIDPYFDTSSAVYLACPEQTDSGKEFLHAVETLSAGKIQEFPLPVKEINIDDDADVSRIINDAHSLADLVVTYDNLLDKKQLEEAGIQIVRYQKDNIYGRNLIVSSKMSAAFTSRVIQKLLLSLSMGGQDNNSLQALAEKITDRAVSLSGTVLLRAAKSMISSQEVLGLVLSKYLLEQQFAAEQQDKKQPELTLKAYFMLDDYAAWFRTSNGMLADILAIGLGKTAAGKFVLSLKIVESKCIAGDDQYESEAKSRSSKQLEATAALFAEAFLPSGDGKCSLERSHWAERLSEMLLDSPDASAHIELLTQARQAIADSDFLLSLSSASLVFNISNSPEADSVPVYGIIDSKNKAVRNARQVTIRRTMVRELLYALSQNSNPAAVLDLQEQYLPDDPGLLSADFVSVSPGIDLLQPAGACMQTQNECSQEVSEQAETDKQGFKERAEQQTQTEVPSADETQATAEITEQSAAEDRYSTFLTAGSGNKEQSEAKAAATELTAEAEQPVLSEKPAEAAADTAVSRSGIAMPAQSESDERKPAGEQTPGSSADTASKPAVHTADTHWGSHLHDLIVRKAGAIQQSEQLQERLTWGKNTALTLQRALNRYEMQAELLEWHLTPNGVLAVFRGTDTLTVKAVRSNIERLYSVRYMTVTDVRAAPGRICISVASDYRETVSLWDVWAQRRFNLNKSGANTSFVIGLKEFDNQILYLNYGSEFAGLGQHEPHTLVAGGTGSGKSVLLRTLILDIAATNSPATAQLLLIDPKAGTEFKRFRTLPHMWKKQGIVTEQQAAVKQLNDLVQEMEQRYKDMAQADCNEISEFNCTLPEAERRPLIFVVHDEFADWMMDDSYKKSVKSIVSKLGVKARAAGIYLIFAAQRPDKDVMPIQLRANLGNRLALKVADAATSEIVLDKGETTAAKLQGKGQLLAKLAGQFYLAQVPFLSNSDLAEAIEAICQDSKA